MSVTLVAEVCLIINTECSSSGRRYFAGPDAVLAQLFIVVLIHWRHDLDLTCHFVKQTTSFLIKDLVQMRYIVRTLELRLLDLD